MIHEYTKVFLSDTPHKVQFSILAGAKLEIICLCAKKSGDRAGRGKDCHPNISVFLCSATSMKIKPSNLRYTGKDHYIYKTGTITINIV
jgi:hypothetical protein